MTSRGIQFFAMPDELEAILSEVTTPLQLCFLVEGKHPSPRFIRRALTDAMKREWWRFYITDVDFPAVYPAQDLTPARHGLVTCDRPRFEDNFLLLGELSSKSDWADEDNHSQENPDGHRLLAKLRKVIQKHATNQICARNIKFGGEAGPVRGLKCTDGVVAWHRAGGLLRQWGVQNIDFFPAS